MINGFCFGGAFSIVEGCDLAIASEEATLGLSEINFKLFPGGCVSKSLANLLRPRDALWYGMTGRPFDGKTAEKIGLINLAVPKDQLVAETMQVAKELAAKDPHAMAATKEAYHMSLEMSVGRGDGLRLREGAGAGVCARETPGKRRVSAIS